MCISISIDILVNSFMFISSTVVVTAAAGDGDQAQKTDDDHSEQTQDSMESKKYSMCNKCRTDVVWICPFLVPDNQLLASLST